MDHCCKVQPSNDVRSGVEQHRQPPHLSDPDRAGALGRLFRVKSACASSIFIVHLFKSWRVLPKPRGLTYTPDGRGFVPYVGYGGVGEEDDGEALRDEVAHHLRGGRGRALEVEEGSALVLFLLVLVVEGGFGAEAKGRPLDQSHCVHRQHSDRSLCLCPRMRSRWKFIRLFAVN